MGTFVYFILNSIFVSLPEELYLVVLTVILSGRINLINLERKNLARLLVPVVTLAFSFNIIRILLKLDFAYMPYIGIALSAVYIILSYEIKGRKNRGICIAASIISYLSIGLIQIAYLPLLMSMSGIDTNELVNMGPAMFLYTLPERFIEAGIIAVVFVRKKHIAKVNPLEVILKSRVVTLWFFANLLFDLVFVGVSAVYIFKFHALDNVPAIMKIVSSILIFMIPVINISGIISIVYVLAYKEVIKKIYLVEETKCMNALINVLTNRGQYKSISHELRQFESQIEEIGPKIRMNKKDI